MNLCSHNSPYSLNCHIGAMLVFCMLCRITQSSDAHRTESVSVMDHEQTMAVNSRVLDQNQQNIFGRISLSWSVELQGCPEQLYGGDHWPRLADSDIGEHRLSKVPHDVYRMVTHPSHSISWLQLRLMSIEWTSQHYQNKYKCIISITYVYICIISLTDISVPVWSSYFKLIGFLFGDVMTSIFDVMAWNCLFTSTLECFEGRMIFPPKWQHRWTSF